MRFYFALSFNCVKLFSFLKNISDISYVYYFSDGETYHYDEILAIVTLSLFLG